ncbi:MAG: RtcB family protein [Nitrospira sp.]|nr:RtcB family protein [Nitrospira sp.]
MTASFQKKAMRASNNYALANRQIVTRLLRQVFAMCGTGNGGHSSCSIYALVGTVIFLFYHPRPGKPGVVPQ